MSWIEATEVPVSMEGMPAWKWVENPRHQGPVVMDSIPYGFSREPALAKGVWFWPVEAPLPPTCISSLTSHAKVE